METIPFEKTPKRRSLLNFIGHILSGPHCEGYPSEFPRHPLDTPIKPVTDWPTQQLSRLEIQELLARETDDGIPAYDSAGSYYFNHPEQPDYIKRIVEDLD